MSGPLYMNNNLINKQCTNESFLKVDGSNKMLADLDLDYTIELINVRDNVTDSLAVMNNKYVDQCHMTPSGHQKKRLSIFDGSVSVFKELLIFKTFITR